MNPMRILVTYALEPEFAPWRRLREFHRGGAAWPVVFESSAAGLDLRVVLTGVGADPARRAMTVAFSPRPDVCISTGVAGGLAPGQRIGEVLAASATRELASQRIIASDPTLLAAAIHAGARPAECFCTSDDLVISGEGKRRLNPMGQAVEMEGFHILIEAERRIIPALAIRSLSDLAEHDLPFDFQLMLNPQGRLIPSQIARAILRAPQRIPELIRLRNRTAQAARSLARVLESLVRALANTASPESSPALAQAVRP
jgi:nucleoside phosphorylase